MMSERERRLEAQLGNKCVDDGLIAAEWRRDFMFTPLCFHISAHFYYIISITLIQFFRYLTQHFYLQTHCWFLRVNADSYT